MVPERMNFGIFMAPFHRTGENPTLCLQRDLELISWLDTLGYDEAWIGEHHSGGWETIASPEVFIGVAAERTRNIRLGTGVVSIPYHHPFHVADRMVLLDHLTRGRVMLGVGPGALPSDAKMLAIEPTRQREMMDEGLGVIIRLMTEDEPITHETDWFKLRDAQLQLKPYQRPHMPMAVASTLSPAGMQTAGKHGAGVLSVASYAPEGLAALSTQWQFCEEAADKAGRPAPDRHDWRVVMPFHLADSREEAIKDIEEGVLAWNNEYYVNTLGAPMRDARQERPRDGREPHRLRRLHRHARRRHRRHPEAPRRLRRLRRHARPRPRLGPAREDPPQLRALRPLRRPPLPGHPHLGRPLPEMDRLTTKSSS